MENFSSCSELPASRPEKLSLILSIIICSWMMFLNNVRRVLLVYLIYKPWIIYSSTLLTSSPSLLGVDTFPVVSSVISYIRAPSKILSSSIFCSDSILWSLKWYWKIYFELKFVWYMAFRDTKNNMTENYIDMRPTSLVIWSIDKTYMIKQVIYAISNTIENIVFML